MVRIDELPRGYGFRPGFNLSYHRRNIVLSVVTDNLQDEIDIPYSDLTEAMHTHEFHTIYLTRKAIRNSLRIHESMLRRAREGVIVLGIGEEFYSEDELSAISYGIKKHKVFLQHPVFFMD